MYASTITLPDNIATGLYTFTLLCGAAGCESTVPVTITSPTPTPPAAGVFVPFSSTAPEDGELWLQNTALQVRIHLKKGGMIDFISKDGGQSVINDYRMSGVPRPDDLGRQVGAAIYRWPNGVQIQNAYCEGGECTIRYNGDGSPNGGIGYNGVQGGDEQRYPSAILASGVKEVQGYGTMVYTKTLPNNWHLTNKATHYTIEQWVWLEGNTIKMHRRITGLGTLPDMQQREARTQELSYCYVTAKHTQYYAVLRGNGPERIDQWLAAHRGDGSPQTGFQKDFGFHSGEPWMAAIDPTTGQGVGYVSTHGYHEFQIKRFGDSGSGDPKANDSGYMAATPQLIVDRDLVYDYEDAIVLGTLSEIQTKARSLTAMLNTKPHYVFTSSRQDVVYMKGVDTGWQVPGRLVITPYDKRFEVHLPTKTFNGADVNKLYIRMKYTGTESKLRLRWKLPDQTESEAFYAALQGADQVIEFNVESGVDKVYEIPVGQLNAWKNNKISVIKLTRVTIPQTEDLNQQALSGESIELYGFSYKPVNQW